MEQKQGKKTADQQFAEMIISKLQAGTTPWQRGWSVNEALRKPFHNCVSEKEYHGANIVRLWITCEMRGYADHRFITYKQAQDKGWQVRQGEKGTYISFFKPIIKENENSESEDDEKKVYFAIKGYTVFNAAQVEGIDPLPAPEEYEWNPLELGEAIIAASGADIKENELAPCPAYNPNKDYIETPPRKRFISAAEYYASITHELAHWTGAASRLARDLKGHGNIAEYAREELRAEIASWMISMETGLPFNPDNHAAYVAGWIKAIKNDYREIFRACADAERIKDYILNFVKADNKQEA